MGVELPEVERGAPAVGVEELSRLPLFRGWRRRDLSRLANVARRRRLAPGDVICEQGAPARSAYVVLRGRLAALLRRPEGWRLVGEVTRGEVLGEAALLADGQRGATVVALRESELAEVVRADFDALLAAQPRFAVGLCRLLATRLLQATAGGRRRPPPARIVGLCALTDGLDLAAFAEALAGAAGEGSTIHAFGPARTAEVWSAGGSGALAAWLDRLEHERALVLVCVDTRDAGLVRALQQRVDRFLLLIRPGEAARLAPDLLAPADARPSYGLDAGELVFLHPPGCTMPRHIRAQLSRLPALPHRHLREGDTGHCARLVRALAGRTRALVMGGGGARGFAHIGVYRALSEAGIDVDAVGGTSMGAIVAAMVACEHDWREIAERCRQTFVDRNPANDYTLPLTAILRGRKATMAFREAFGELDIEDLWRPAFFVSTNLSRPRAHAERSGPIWLALRASTAIPGVFPPVVRNGELFVDGGLVDNLPADIAEDAWRPGTLIAVDVASASGPVAPGIEGPSLDAWQLICARLARRRPPPPTIVDILWASSTLASEMTLERVHDRVDLLIRPELTRFALLDWRPLNAIVEAGYRATSQALESGAISADRPPGDR